MRRRIHTLALVLLWVGIGVWSQSSFAQGPKGYAARPCGFDMNRNGLVGEADDAHVADGNTTDPDGDTVNEDLIYVDAASGSDTTGNGSPGNPYKTAQKALNVADGPGDGAEDIICLAGTFTETLTIRDSGLVGYYVREDFQFPQNPLMIVGWDRDGDGAYPPYDVDDEAVLDGNLFDGNQLALAITTDSKRSYLEIAHLTIRNYGGANYALSGAFKLFHWGGGLQSHVYIHDVEMRAINKAIPDSSARIVCSFWGGPFTDVAIINNLVDEFSSYFCRGSPPSGAGRFRFQNNTLKMYGISSGSFVTGWKLWGLHTDVEILDNVISCNAAAWGPVKHTSGIGVCQGTQDWLIRGNVLIDLPITLQPYAAGYYQGRQLDNIRIDRNVFWSTYDGWDVDRSMINITGQADANVEESVKNVWITNNFFTTSTGYHTAIKCTGGNGNAPQTGTIHIAGNTMYGPFDSNTIWGPHHGAGIGITPVADLPYKHNSFVIKNNIIANAGGGKNVEVSYAPTNFIANGNIYNPSVPFRWNTTDHWVTISFAAWQTATGQDANSTLGDPVFVDAPNDLHIDPNDTLVEGAGVDITSITTVDFDGDERTAETPWPGADVRLETQPPTILAWYSAATHGRGVGEALLEIHDDGNFSEPRSGGIARLILAFDEPIDPASLLSANVAIAGRDANNTPIDCNSIAIGTSTRNGHTEAVITFTPALGDYARYIVQISGVTDAVGNPLAGDADRIVTALVSDASGDLRVNATDLSEVRASRTRRVDKNNSGQVRADISQDGRVNATDRSRVRVRRSRDARGIDDPTIN